MRRGEEIPLKAQKAAIVMRENGLTLEVVRARIKEEYGVSMSPSSVHRIEQRAKQGGAGRTGLQTVYQEAVAASTLARSEMEMEVSSVMKEIAVKLKDSLATIELVGGKASVAQVKTLSEALRNLAQVGKDVGFFGNDGGKRDGGDEDGALPEMTDEEYDAFDTAGGGPPPVGALVGEVREGGSSSEEDGGGEMPQEPLLLDGDAHEDEGPG